MRLVLIAAVIFSFALPVSAEELQTYVTTELARVISVSETRESTVPGIGVPAVYQTLRAEILEGPSQGAIVTVQNDYLELTVGDRFYAQHTVDAITKTDFYAVSEPYRLDGLLLLVGLFVAAVVLIGGTQGIRGLLALSASFFVVGYVLLPSILEGVPPLLAAFGVASLIVVIGSYITHGVNRVTTAAVFGMIATIGFTIFLAHLAVGIAHLTGFTSDEAVYLNLDTAGRIDFAGLLLAGMLIGILGVLYDAAIGQAVSVDELHSAAPAVTRLELWKRAMRIGREHIGALVNTLAIAYVGVALPLLLLFYSLNSDTSILTTLNREVFAEEIVRITVGSIGVVLAVPVTTAIAVVMLIRGSGKPKKP